MYLTMEDLERMKAVDIETVDRESLTDLNDIVIDTKKSVAAKLSQFASQTDNLFVNKVGDYVVKVTYMDTKFTVNDKMKNHIARLAEINY